MNIYGYFFMTRFPPEAGKAIINTGSITARGQQAARLQRHQRAIHAFTKSLEPVDKKIRGNCVSPGPVWTLEPF
jgi:NAD(P)-dependent dehydrogenase (short-subunit alcohol dehydrogenase family)